MKFEIKKQLLNPEFEGYKYEKCIHDVIPNRVPAKLIIPETYSFAKLQSFFNSTKCMASCGSTVAYFDENFNIEVVGIGNYNTLKSETVLPPVLLTNGEYLFCALGGNVLEVLSSKSLDLISRYTHNEPFCLLGAKVSENVEILVYNESFTGFSICFSLDLNFVSSNLLWECDSSPILVEPVENDWIIFSNFKIQKCIPKVTFVQDEKSISAEFSVSSIEDITYSIKSESITIHLDGVCILHKHTFGLIDPNNSTFEKKSNSIFLKLYKQQEIEWKSIWQETKYQENNEFCTLANSMIQVPLFDMRLICKSYPSGVCLKNGYDGCCFVDFNHIYTMNALWYVLSSKKDKKITGCCRDFAFCVESTGEVYIYKDQKQHFLKISTPIIGAEILNGNLQILSEKEMICIKTK